MDQNKNLGKRTLIALTDESDLPSLITKLNQMYLRPVRLTRVKGKNRRNLIKKYKLVERVNSLSPSKKAVMINFSKQFLVIHFDF